MKQWQKKKVDELKEKVEGLIQAKARRIPESFEEFCEKWLGLKLTDYQRAGAELIKRKDSVALRWSRQSGKTHMVSAWLLHYALRHPGSQIAIVGPSWRQTKIPIRKINGFLPKLPKGLYKKPQATMVTTSNHSLIQAFPCNPETIRGFTLNVLYADEFNYVPLDQELYDAIVFTLSTTNGKFVCSSTPGATDSMFWKFFNRPQYRHFAKSHVTWQQALEPNGPLKKRKVEQLKEEYCDDRFRWQREMEAEWAEDEAVWLPLSLITKCQDASLELWDSETVHQGTFFGGVDFGKEQDYSAFAVAEKVGSKSLLRHLKVWPLETKYAAVIGYVKTFADRWQSFEKIRCDITGVGNYIVEDMINGGIENVEGVSFSHPRKQEMASLLKQRMLNSAFAYPYAEVNVSPSKKLNFSTELNTERFELKKDGTYRFFHPQNQHDDVFWATALALYATVEMQPEPFLAVIPRRANKLHRVRKELAKRKVMGDGR
jgi:phage FluMu gp28-like protein